MGIEKRVRRQAKHLRWVLPFAAAPLAYVLAMLVGNEVGRVAREQGNFGASIGSLSIYALALIAPIILIIVALRGAWRLWRMWRRSNGHFTRAEREANERRDRHIEGWRYGQQMRALLLRRELPPQVSIWGLVPRVGEVFFLSGDAQYARYYGADAHYRQSSIVAFGGPLWVAGSLIGNAISNAAERNRAERMARSQWRELQVSHVVASNQRILCNVADHGWLSFDYGAVSAVHPDPERYSIVLEFPGTPPLMLTGPMIPSLTAIAVFQTLGADALGGHPAMRILER